MRTIASFIILALLGAIALTSTVTLADYPKPSPYPISWELKFEHGIPRRVLVQLPGTAVPQAYWYITYTVTNNSDKPQTFLPVFEMLTKDGQVIRADMNIPAVVFQTIKAREKKQFLEPFPTIAGELRVGEDQARDGVAIWPEPMPQMGTFSVFIAGLSGETIELKDGKGDPIKSSDGKQVFLHKSLQLEFLVRGDESHSSQDQVVENDSRWVMR